MGGILEGNRLKCVVNFLHMSLTKCGFLVSANTKECVSHVCPHVSTALPQGRRYWLCLLKAFRGTCANIPSAQFQDKLPNGLNPKINNARSEKAGSRLAFSQIEPNRPLPYSTVPVPWLRDARPAGWVTYCSICASTMPRAQNRAGKGSILL